jgi:hypothetical protein
LGTEDVLKRELEALRVPLELTADGQGGAQGKLDGVPLRLTRRGVLEVPLAARWPSIIVTLPAPPPGATRHLGAAKLVNASQKPEWMARAFADPSLNDLLSAVDEGCLRIHVRDDALAAELLGKTVDGPALRKSAHVLVSLARALPGVMAKTVDAWSRQDLAEQLARHEKAVARGRREGWIPLEVRLRSRVGSLNVWSFFLRIFGAVGLGGLALAGSLWALVPGGVLLMSYWMLTWVRCPQCEVRMGLDGPSLATISPLNASAALAGAFWLPFITCPRCGIRTR